MELINLIYAKENGEHPEFPFFIEIRNIVKYKMIIADPKQYDTVFLFIFNK